MWVLGFVWQILIFGVALHLGKDSVRRNTPPGLIVSCGVLGNPGMVGYRCFVLYNIKSAVLA